MPWDLLTQTGVSFKTYSSSQTQFSVNSSKRVHFQHIFIYIYIHTHTNTRIFIYTYIYVHFSICIYIHTHTPFSLLKTVKKSFSEKYFPRPATEGVKFSYF